MTRNPVVGAADGQGGGMSIRRGRSRWLLFTLAAALAACGHSPTDPGDGTNILFNLSSPEVVIGDTVQLIATVRDPAGNAIPNVTLAWSSLDTNIATVSPDGLVTAIGWGDTDIQVEATIPDVAQMTRPVWLNRVLSLIETPVHAAKPKMIVKKNKILVRPNVVVSPATASVAVNGKQEFTVKLTNKKELPLNVQPTITWSSSNQSVATVDIAGFATGKANGSTDITAVVRVGAAPTATGKAKLTVSDQCDGIGSVSAIDGSVNYDYETTGTGGGAKIHSKFSSAGVKATMAREFVNTDEGVAQWRGKATGSAVQSETMTYSTGGEYTLNSTGGAFTAAEMVVIVDLLKCTYRIVTTVVYPIKRTDTDSNNGGVDIEQAYSPLHKKNDAGSYFGNIPPFVPFKATKNPLTTESVFVVSGFAGYIDGDLGSAEVSFTLSVAGTSQQLLALSPSRTRGELEFIKPCASSSAFSLLSSPRCFWSPGLRPSNPRRVSPWRTNSTISTSGPSGPP